MPPDAIDDRTGPYGGSDARRSRGLAAALERRFAASPRERAPERPADVVEEERVYRGMRERKGWPGTRARRPTLLAAAARAPGEVARSLLTVASYLVLLLVLVALAREAFGRLPGIVQVVLLVLLVVPSMAISTLVWTRIGERARDQLRTLVRFWPLTLALGILALGVARLLLA